MSAEAEIGLIGGSGLYEMRGLRILHERSIETPFGAPSDSYVIGDLEGIRVAFLARHGRGHVHAPSELNFRANIYGFKILGAGMIVSASAVGSMKEQYAPTDIVIPHQFIDRTRHRADTFFGDGIVAHVGFADPICLRVASALESASSDCGAKVHSGGTYLCMEGPQFSTRAESHLYRSWGVDVIGMTNLQEAKLSREAEICYATLALVTDYDCWHEAEEDVTVEQVLGYLRQNASTACAILRNAVIRLAGSDRSCGCSSALQYAILTDRNRIPPGKRDALWPIIGKYI